MKAIKEKHTDFLKTDMGEFHKEEAVGMQILSSIDVIYGARGSDPLLRHARTMTL